MTPEINPIETIRELATHTSDIRHLQDDMDKLVKDMEEIKQSMHAIQRALSEADGGRKVLFGSISAAGVLGSFFMWLVDRFFLK